MLAMRLKHDAESGAKVVRCHRAAADADFVKGLASALDEALEAAGALLLVTVGEGEGEGTFTLSGPPALVTAASTAVAEALDGRGGGKSGRYQGKCARLAGRDAATTAAQAIVVGAQ